jgi:hypothetical protein
MRAGINPAAIRRYPLMREAESLSHRFFWGYFGFENRLFMLYFSQVLGVLSPSRAISCRLISSNSLVKIKLSGTLRGTPCVGRDFGDFVRFCLKSPPHIAEPREIPKTLGFIASLIGW